jgi:hypothetical protein
MRHEARALRAEAALAAALETVKPRFRVQGLGFRVKGFSDLCLGFKMLGFRVLGLEFVSRVKGPGFRV